MKKKITRTCKFMQKTLKGKNHEQRRKKIIISKNRYKKKELKEITRII